MTLADVIILSIIGLSIAYSVYRMIKNRSKDGCAGCSDHAQPKWIKDYKRKI